MRIKNATNIAFDCHLSPFGQQMAIKNSVSNYVVSMFVDSINIFNCPISGVKRRASILKDFSRIFFFFKDISGKSSI